MKINAIVVVVVVMILSERTGYRSDKMEPDKKNYRSISLNKSTNRCVTSSQCSTAVRNVVRATQQVNGKWPFSGCQNSVIPEPID